MKKSLLILSVFLMTLSINELFGEWDVISVPSNPKDPSEPSPIFSGMPITYKWVLRNATPYSKLYYYRCDFNGDGIWDTPNNGNTVPSDANISVTWRAPDELTPKIYIGKVEVSETSYLTTPVDQNRRIATFPVIIYPELTHPSDISKEDPTLWTNGELEILRKVAINEILWYLHTKLTNKTGSGTSTIFGNIPSSLDATAIALQLFTLNGRFPAYPPDTYSHGTAQDVPVLKSGFIAENDYRWQNDPYAETTLRMFNYLAYNLTLVNNIDVADENDNGRDYIPGTNNARGLKSNFQFGDAGRIGAQGALIASLSALLPYLNGTSIQIGLASGHSLEWLIQELVDYLGFAQTDDGNGAWYYDAAQSLGNGESSCWAIYGLSSAELFGSNFKINISNQNKYRIANNLSYFMGNNYGYKRFPSGIGNGNFNFTGGALIGAHWLGIQNFNLGDNDLAFPAQSSLSKDALRTIYDRYQNFTISKWNSINLLDPYSWMDGFWYKSDYLCSSTSKFYTMTDVNINRWGDSYSMFWHTLGYKSKVSDFNIPDHNWKREFAIYLIRSQKWSMDLNYKSILGENARNPALPAHIYMIASGNTIPSAISGIILSSINFKENLTEAPFPEKLAYWLDPKDVNGNGLTPTGSISSWADKGTTPVNAVMSTESRQPVYNANRFGTAKPGVDFEAEYTVYGISDILTSQYDGEITSPNDNMWTPNKQDKSVFVVFQTVNANPAGGYFADGRQMLFETGGPLSGYNLYIAGGKLCVGMWNRFESKFTIFNPPNTTGFYPLSSGNTYLAHIEYNSTSKRFRVVLSDDGGSHTSPFMMDFHGVTKDATDETGVGGATRTRYHDYNTGETYSDHFTGGLGDVMVYNDLFSTSKDQNEVYSYLSGKYAKSWTYPSTGSPKESEWIMLDNEISYQNVKLSEPYPNPFTDRTSFGIYIPSTQNVKIDLYNAAGNKVQSLFSGELNEGMHDFIINGSNLRNGMYIYRVTGNGFIESGKVILLK